MSLIFKVMKYWVFDSEEESPIYTSETRIPITVLLYFLNNGPISTPYFDLKVFQL